jgi:hypothetical protein
MEIMMRAQDSYLHLKIISLIKNKVIQGEEHLLQGENIGRPDGVFILLRWSGPDVQTDFQVDCFHQLSYCGSSC